MAHPRMYDDSNPAIRRLRKVCQALGGVVEKEAWGECTFRVDGGSMFAMTNNHPDAEGFVDLWIKAPQVVQEILVGSAPETFFKPPYLGHKGWVGMHLGKKVDWEQVAELLRDGREMSLPTKRRTATEKAGSRVGAPVKPAKPARRVRSNTRSPRASR